MKVLDPVSVTNLSQQQRLLVAYKGPRSPRPSELLCFLGGRGGGGGGGEGDGLF